MKISVVINTFNSERFLDECLRSVRSFDEIVLCDMHSTDHTVAIAERYGCRIVYHERTGFVEPARNYAISCASNEWVLVLDSDEVIPGALRQYLYGFAGRAEAEGYAALKMARKNYFLGRFMHGDYPDYIIRLIRKSKTYWPEQIHARPIVEGRIFTIPSRRRELAMEHLANESVSARIAKTNQYSDKELIRRRGQDFSVFSAFVKCSWRFLRFYVVKGGFRDGKAGFAYAVLNAFYKFATVAKLWEQGAAGREVGSGGSEQ